MDKYALIRTEDGYEIKRSYKLEVGIDNALYFSDNKENLKDLQIFDLKEMKFEALINE